MKFLKIVGAIRPLAASANGVGQLPVSSRRAETREKSTVYEMMVNPENFQFLSRPGRLD